MMLEKCEDGSWLSPGFIDLQVNGFGGADYNSPATTLEEIARSLEVMRTTGVTRLLPTVITGSSENMLAALQNLSKAKEHLPAIAGISRRKALTFLRKTLAARIPLDGCALPISRSICAGRMRRKAP